MADSCGTSDLGLRDEFEEDEEASSSGEPSGKPREG